LFFKKTGECIDEHVKGGKFSVRLLGKAAGFADKICQAGLPFVYPFLVHTVAVAD
jgi:hypothetical protein